MYKEYINSDKQQDWINYIVESLQGTCDSLSEYRDEYLEQGFDEDELVTQVDSIIFECGDCGWWYEVGKMSDEISDDCICENCASAY